MGTRIKALASFTNQEELSHLDDNHISTGETAVVRHSYALGLRSDNLAEIVEENVEQGEDSGTDTADTDEQEVETSTIEEPESPEPEASEESAEKTGESEQEPEESAESGEAEEDPFSHTEFLASDGTITDKLPKHSLLADRGVTTFDDLAEIADDFQQIKGIGPASEEELEAAWKEIVDKT